MNFRSKILTKTYKLFPFSLKGDLPLKPIVPEYDISCVINFYGRIHLLEGILYSLSEQTLSKERYEVILVEDRGGTTEGKDIAKQFSDKLNIKYHALKENFGKMGYSRNFGLSKAKGKYILFLDDDTVILEESFLPRLMGEFEAEHADAIVPQGAASYALIKGKYDFHDPLFPTNRCMAYRREILKDLNGFVSEMIGQEDVEFVIRFIASGSKYTNSLKLHYFHPPLIYNNLNKATAVGKSFFGLWKRYHFIMWILLFFNGIRHLPLLLFSFRKKWEMQSKFSLGFLKGYLFSLTNRTIDYN